jgi:hypothetical protein
MAEEIKSIAVAEEAIISKIYLIRGQKVMIDRDLSELYGVETKQLKRQVRRNKDRFPEDFMFGLSDKEFQEWRSQFGTSNEGDKMGLRYAPYVFTEQGVAMLSSVLNSEQFFGRPGFEFTLFDEGHVFYCLLEFFQDLGLGGREGFGLYERQVFKEFQDETCFIVFDIEQDLHSRGSDLHRFPHISPGLFYSSCKTVAYAARSN